MKLEWFVIGAVSGFSLSLLLFTALAGDCYLVEKPRSGSKGEEVGKSGD